MKIGYRMRDQFAACSDHEWNEPAWKQKFHRNKEGTQKRTQKFQVKNRNVRFFSKNCTSKIEGNTTKMYAL